MQSFSLRTLAARLCMALFALFSSACGNGSNAPVTAVQAPVAVVPVVPASASIHDPISEPIPEPIPAPPPEPTPPPAPTP